jgi:predicted nucleotidyltransferase component of viral defense system
MSTAKEQSVKERVKVISKKQGRPFNDVWQEVVLERWLSRLANSPYRKNFIFKGAMCLLRYIDLDRETRDLDFLLKDLQGSIENVRKYLGEVSSLDINDGFSFNEIDVRLLEHTHMQYPGYSFSAIGHIGKTKTKIFIDVGVGDAVKPTEITMQLLATEKTPLFEKDIELWAYPVESIFAEKLETSIARGNQNSRMKDYHDLICLVRSDVLKIDLLRPALSETFANRGTQIRAITFESSEIEKIQNYWALYYENLSAETKQELSGQIKEIIGEINAFVLHHNLTDLTKGAR